MMFRDFKKRIRIAWLVLFNQYTNDPKEGCWWLWDDELTKISRRETEDEECDSTIQE